MEQTFTIELYGQTLRVTGNFHEFEEGEIYFSPDIDEYFECEKIEVDTGVHVYNPNPLYSVHDFFDISQLVSEINPDFYQTINKKVIEDLKDKRK